MQITKINEMHLGFILTLCLNSIRTKLFIWHANLNQI
jgi:hypothetical protein